MITVNDWSRIIEGTHAIFCGLFTLFALIYFKNKSYDYFIGYFCWDGSSINEFYTLYGNYVIQCRDPSSINYNTQQFPTGKYYEKRPFIYVNLFWTFMPLMIIIDLLANNNLFAINKSKKYINNEKNKYLETFKA